MFDVPTSLKRAADQNNFQRVRFREADIPTSIENVTMLPFFGDMRSTFIMSSLLLRRVKEELRGSKYFVLASWPGYEGLFPYADEYWTVRDEALIEKLRKGTKGFENTSANYTLLHKGFNKFFYEVLDSTIIKPYYDHGIQQEFFDRFKRVKVSLPDVPSAASLGESFLTNIGKRSGFKVFVYPAREVYSWRRGHSEKIRVSESFWIALLERLVEGDITPVVYRDSFTHDMSPHMTNECVHIWDQSMFKVMGAMRATGCVLDLFSGISRIAIAARTPFLLVDERARYIGEKEYEIDDLCGQNLPREHIFGFTTILENGNKSDWNRNVFDGVVAKLHSFLPKLDRDTWPSTSASYEVVPYDNVRKYKVKRLGTKFIRTPRD